MNVSEVFLYADKYTLLHTSSLMCKNIINSLEEQGIKVDFRIAIIETNIGCDLNKHKEKRKIA